MSLLDLSCDSFEETKYHHSPEKTKDQGKNQYSLLEERLQNRLREIDDLKNDLSQLKMENNFKEEQLQVKEQMIVRLKQRIESMQNQIKEAKNSRGFMSIFSSNSEKEIESLQ